MLNVFLEKISSPTGSIFSLKTLALPTPYLFEAPETKTTEATERRIKKMSDKREAYKVGNSTPSALESALK